MNLTYKYRVLPNKKQHAALTEICESQRQLYNAALQERIDCYRKTGKSISCFDQFNSLTVWRAEDGEAAALPLTIQRWTLRRVENAYAIFFRRVRGRKFGGFPRFRSKSRWRSFGFNQNGIRLDGSRLRFKGFPGGLRVHFHRPIPKGASIRACVFTKDIKGWYVCFQVRVVSRFKRDIFSAVGLDLGLKVFAYQSDGSSIPSLKAAQRSYKELRRKQRALSRCAQGSKRRNKVRNTLVRVNRRLVNYRNTWLHQQSKRLVKTHDLIAVESLPIQGMLQNARFASDIQDASWARFLGFIAYKAERAGKHFIRVDPRNTSQKCSGCGSLVPKSLKTRTHSCPECGLVLDRDHNAAINILNAAVLSRGQHNVGQWPERAAGNLSLTAEPVPMFITK